MGTWTEWNTLKRDIMKGVQDLDTNSYRVLLFKGSFSTTAAQYSTYGSISGTGNEVSALGGYVKGLGKDLGTTSIVESGANAYWSASNVVITASGAEITSIQYAVICKSDGTTCESTDPIVGWATLSSSAFSVGTSNTLTINLSNGIFQVT